jgi:hypothetical protein
LLNSPAPNTAHRPGATLRRQGGRDGLRRCGGGAGAATPRGRLMVISFNIYHIYHIYTPYIWLYMYHIYIYVCRITYYAVYISMIMLYVYIYIYLWLYIYICIIIYYDLSYIYAVMIYDIHDYIWYMDLIEHEAFYRVKSPCLSGCRKGRRGEWPGVCRPEGLRGETLGKHWSQGCSSSTSRILGSFFGDTLW